MVLVYTTKLEYFDASQKNKCGLDPALAHPFGGKAREHVLFPLFPNHTVHQLPCLHHQLLPQKARKPSQLSLYSWATSHTGNEHFIAN